MKKSISVFLLLPIVAGLILGVYAKDIWPDAEVFGVADKVELILLLVTMCVFVTLGVKSVTTGNAPPSSWQKPFQVGIALVMLASLTKLYAYFVGFAPRWEQPLELSVIILMFAGLGGMLMALLKRKPWQQ